MACEELDTQIEQVKINAKLASILVMVGPVRMEAYLKVCKLSTYFVQSLELYHLHCVFIHLI